MTINIALATSEGLVLGCDSIASSVEYVIDPFELEQPSDEEGEPLDGRMPPAVDTELPSELEVSLPWNQFKVGFDYGNLPLQSAVAFVAFLVNLQPGKSRFAPGVATVGGRTQVAVISKGEGFRMLNEPDLQHRHTGFGDDV